MGVLVAGLAAAGPLGSGIGLKNLVYERRTYAERPDLREPVEPPVRVDSSAHGGRGSGVEKSVRAAPMEAVRAPVPGRSPASIPVAPSAADTRGGAPGIAVEARLVVLPHAVLEKYSHFEDLVEAGRSASSELVTLPDGAQGLELTALAPDSPLASLLDLQVNDVIVTVNGYPPDRENARQLYDVLKDCRVFEVVIERGGQRRPHTYRIQ